MGLLFSIAMEVSYTTVYMTTTHSNGQSVQSNQQKAQTPGNERTEPVRNPSNYRNAGSNGSTPSTRPVRPTLFQASSLPQNPSRLPFRH